MTGKPTPDYTAGLEPDDAERVIALVGEAIARESKALDKAVSGGLRRIPRLLRGPIKAVLFR
jgi:hypothetical protein